MRIDSFSFGKMVVEGKEYDRDLIILPEGRVIPNWWREKGHIFSLGDCEALLEESPDFIVFGLGIWGRARLADDLEAELARRGIEYRAVTTGKAMELFNSAAGGRLAGAFHLTC